MKNAEFENKKLAQIYENFNQFSKDEDFWLRTIKSLGVTSIIDFGCGSGLFTLDLGARGYRVTGIEPAKEMLEIAKSKQGAHTIKWREGTTNMLSGLKSDLILLTSHVSQFLIDEVEWKEFLDESYKALNIGAYILFDSKNPLKEPWNNYTRQNYNTTKSTQFGDVNMQIEAKEKNKNIITHSIYYHFLKTGEKFISDNTLIYRTKEEIQSDLEKAGFTLRQIYGDWNGKEYFPECDEMIFLAQK